MGSEMIQRKTPKRLKGDEKLRSGSPTDRGLCFVSVVNPKVCWIIKCCRECQKVGIHLIKQLSLSNLRLIHVL